MRKEGWVEGAILCLILVAAGWLRFAGLSERGYLFLDEGVYYEDSQFHGGLLLACRSGGWSQGLAYLNDPRRWAGDPPLHAKPGYTLLGSVAIGLFGMTPEVMLRISAACGLLTVLLTWLLGRRLGGRWVGLGGAGFLALSAAHINYSRAALSEAAATLAFILALWLYLWARAGAAPRRRAFGVFMSGAAAAWAFLANRRLPMLPFLFAGFEWFSGQGSLRRCAWWLMGWASPFLLVEMLTSWMDHLSASSIPTYFDQLVSLTRQYVLSRKLSHGFRFDGWIAYPYDLLRLEGPIMFGLAAAGLILCLRRGRWTALVVTGAVGLIWAFFAGYWLSLLRNVSVVWPLLMLAAAMAVVALGRRRLLTAVLLAAVWTSQLPGALAAQQLKSGYRKAIAWISKAERCPPGDLGLLTTQVEIFRSFTGSPRMAAPLVNAETLPMILDRYRVRHLVVDYQALTGGFFSHPRREKVTEDFLRWLEGSGVQPVVTLPNSGGASEWVQFEHTKRISETWNLLKDPVHRARMGVIRIYDLKEIAKRYP
ncbi:MAG: glycosyltransferase family 39 protein [Candidatus Omnitrophica bacterium]|nr:glycosyltransferase family 39 protein [Candidatus Omnitrophota bacterium]